MTKFNDHIAEVPDPVQTILRELAAHIDQLYDGHRVFTEKELPDAVYPLTTDIERLDDAVAALTEQLADLARSLELLSHLRQALSPVVALDDPPADDRRIAPLKQAIQALDDRLKLVEKNWG